MTETSGFWSTEDKARGNSLRNASDSALWRVGLLRYQVKTDGLLVSSWMISKEVCDEDEDDIFAGCDILQDGTYLTAREVFESLDLTGYDLDVDPLDVHADKNTFHQYPYMGESKVSGTNFASWIVNNELYSDNVVWLIQLPRLYNIYKEMGIVTSFQTILDFTIYTRLQLTCVPFESSKGIEDYEHTEDDEHYVEARDSV
ncbi:AMP deaminase-like protein [Tanacetum coccineum]